MAEPSRPLIADYVEASREGILRGVTCASCGHPSITAGVVCGKCGGADLRATDFAGVGTVVSFTILSVPPEAFLDEAPYAFIIVQLEEGPRCTGWMPSVKRPEDLRIGDRVRFVKTYKPGMVFEKAL